jgi:hypothetical protein
MKSIPSKTYNIFTMHTLEDLVKEIYGVDYMILRSYTQTHLPTDAVRFYDPEVGLDAWESEEVVQAYIADTANPVPNPITFVAYMVKNKVIPEGPYLLELSWGHDINDFRVY